MWVHNRRVTNELNGMQKPQRYGSHIIFENILFFILFVFLCTYMQIQSNCNYPKKIKPCLVRCPFDDISNIIRIMTILYEYVSLSLDHDIFFIFLFFIIQAIVRNFPNDVGHDAIARI